MDRLNELRSESGGSRDSTLDTTSPPSEAFMSANESSSKYFSINDSTFDVAPIKDVSLPSTSADADRALADNDELISNLSPIGKKERLDSYKIGKQIEAANILSGGVDIFDDNSFDGDELVIDDNAEVEDKVNNPPEVLPVEEIVEPELAIEERELAIEERELAIEQPELAIEQPELAIEQPELAIEQPELAIEQPELAIEQPELAIEQPELAIEQPELAIEVPELAIEEAAVNEPAEPVEPDANAANREMEVVLQIDGTNVNAIDIGNGLYLYRKDGQDELAAIQITNDDPQHNFKFLKVRDNAEGNLEVYEEIEIEVPKEVPTKEGKSVDKNAPHVPTVDVSKQIGDSKNQLEEKTKSPQKEPIPSTSRSQSYAEVAGPSSEPKAEVNLNGKMKFNESRKSPVIGSFTPMTFHSTPNKEGKPLTKTMVDFQLDPNRHSDNIKKTIEVHTDNVKQKSSEVLMKEKDIVESDKSLDSTLSEKDVPEKNKSAYKKNLRKEHEQKDFVVTNKGPETSKPKIDIDKDVTDSKSDTKEQNIDEKYVMARNDESNIEIKSETSEGANLSNLILPDNKQQSDIDISEPKIAVSSSVTSPIDQNIARSDMTTAVSIDTVDHNIKPAVEKEKSVDSMNKLILDLNNTRNDSTENKSNSEESFKPSTSSCTDETKSEKNEEKKGENYFKDNEHRIITENKKDDQKIDNKRMDTIITEHNIVEKNITDQSIDKRIEVSKDIINIKDQKDEKKIVDQKDEKKIEDQKDEKKIEDTKEQKVVEDRKEENKIENKKEENKIEDKKEENQIEDKKEDNKIKDKKEQNKIEDKKEENKIEDRQEEIKIEDNQKDIKIEDRQKEEKIKDRLDDKKIQEKKDEKKFCDRKDDRTKLVEMAAPAINVSKKSSAEKVDDIIDFPIESFTDVSSTCTNLENEGSKGESITLYSIDTDESVSLITPSSVNKTSHDKVVLPDTITNVLTSINNINDIETGIPSRSVTNLIKPLPSNETHVLVRNKVDISRSLQCVKESLAKLERNPERQNSLSQTSSIRIPDTNILVKPGIFIPVRNIPVRQADSSGQQTSILKTNPIEAIGSTSKVDIKPPPFIVDTQTIEKRKQPVKTIEEIRTKPVNQQDGPCKAMEILKIPDKQVKLAPKIESKTTDRPIILPATSIVKMSEKKPTIPLIKQTGNINITNSTKVEIKQPEISSTVNVRALKPESHIPVVSVSSKPNTKHIQSFKVEGVAKSISIVNQKEIAKNNEANKLTVTKVEARDTKQPIGKVTLEPKPVNNNHAAAVPFGKWTDEHRQEFLNKFKEVKVPVNSNTKQIKSSNDLNRRDVLQKIDSQRAQTISNATAKAQDKTNLKTECMFSNKVVSSALEIKILPKQEIIDIKHKQPLNKASIKPENLPKTVASSKAPMSSVKNINTAAVSKPKTTPKVQTMGAKNEVNHKEKIVIGKAEHCQQHQMSVTKTETVPREQNTASCFMASLIDRTIEDMINRVVPGKHPDEAKQVTVTSEPGPNASKQVLPQENLKPIVNKSVSLDDIEMKMNELHGIPFVERPPHELPKLSKSELKTYSKAQQHTNIPIAPKLLKEANSDDEAVEHEPITGDMDLNKRNVPSKITSQDKNNVVVKSKEGITDKNKREPEIITETDFDKFARRNSITYENCLTVNFDHKEQHNQTVKEKDTSAKLQLKQDIVRNESKSMLSHKQLLRLDLQANKNQTAKNDNVSVDSNNKKYQSKIHTAYQTAMTAKQQVSPPISIIEDKPVKVVFLDSNTGFVPSQLNVQGQELSPAKRPAQEAKTTVADNYSLDSLLIEDNDTLNKQSDVIDENKQQDRTKIKHQRKQVLTPVEAPDLELIQPSDIGIENNTKKKRKLEDTRSKNLLPKKSYLLDRNMGEDKTANSQTSKDIKQNMPEHKNAASAIDNLVKAAELLDNQEGSLNKSITQSPTVDTPNTPVKRGRGRPRKYPLPEGAANNKTPSPQKKPRLIDAKPIKQDYFSDDQDDESSGDEMVRENWTMGKINENIVCPICNKLFRSENVVFKHVKHCTGVSPSRSDSDKRSPRRSRLSQESEDTDQDYELPISEIKKDSPKRRRPKESSNTDTAPGTPKPESNKDDVIVIEDTPIKENIEKTIKEKEDESKKVSNAKLPHRNNSLVCEFCGKAFRQHSYLASHKLLHKKELAKKNETNIQDATKPEVFSCEVCKKQFRKLHHLVQHRFNHNPDSAPKRALRKSSEHTDSKNVKENAVAKQEDASAGFRCEPCDKSFRKLHHLVEHRGTHDGINRHKPAAPVLPPQEKPTPPPTCDICNKTFRQLHHLIEHKETHADTNSDKSDEKSVKSALSTKDIIHECSLCYMVFPNEHSLNKHTAICSKKKRQSKQLKEVTVDDPAKDEENLEEKKDEKTDNAPNIIAMEVIDDEDSTFKERDEVTVEKLPEKENKDEVNESFAMEDTPKMDIEVTEKPLDNQEVKDTIQTEVDVKSKEIQDKQSSDDSAQSNSTKNKEEPVVLEKNKKSDLKELKAQDVQKKKIQPKEKPVTPKRPKSVDAPPPVTETVKPSVESSDDDEVRYMFNPAFKPDESSEGKTFMKVRAKKRNSLQIERPSSNDVAKRRTSLQHPPKIPRLKTKHVETKTKATEAKPKVVEMKTKVVEPKTKVVDLKPKEVKQKSTDLKSKVAEFSIKSLEVKSKVENKNSSVPVVKPKVFPKISEKEAVSTDSDDSDVKYSFPETASEESKPAPEKTSKTAEKKVLRKSLAEKRKSLGGIAKRKSVGKGINAKQKDIPSPVKPIKKRWAVIEHRCDCGQLFSSAALLARHTSLAHTPPRIRRRRDPDPPQPEDKPQKKPSIKPGPKETTKPVRPPPPKPNRKPPKKPSPEPEQRPSRTTRRSAAHSGVPVPEKMRKLLNKSLKRKIRDPSWDLD